MVIAAERITRELRLHVIEYMNAAFLERKRYKPQQDPYVLAIADAIKIVNRSNRDYKATFADTELDILIGLQKRMTEPEG